MAIFFLSAFWLLFLRMFLYNIDSIDWLPLLSVWCFEYLSLPLLLLRSYHNLPSIMLLQWRLKGVFGNYVLLFTRRKNVWLVYSSYILHFILCIIYISNLGFVKVKNNLFFIYEKLLFIYFISKISSQNNFNWICIF